MSLWPVGLGSTGANAPTDNAPITTQLTEKQESSSREARGSRGLGGFRDFRIDHAIWLVIALGLLFRVLLAVMRSDAVWPDEQFQSLEPAAHVIFGRGILSWEWQQAYRSWTLPVMYMPLLWVCKLVGITGGLVPILAARAMTAVLAALAVWRFHAMLVLLGIRPWARLLAVAAFALSAPMLLWGPTTLGDNWVMIAWVCFLPTIVSLSQPDSPPQEGRTHKNARWFWIGVLAGLPILIKIQAVVLAFGLGLGFLVARKPIRSLLAFSGGIAANLLILGGMDWIAYGRPFSSLIEQFKRGAQVARFYGVSPWYDYFPRLWENQSGWLFAALALSFLGAAWRWRGVLRFARPCWQTLWAALVPGVFYFGFHCLIAHKETRFMLPVLPVLYTLLAVALNQCAWVARVARWRFFSAEKRAQRRERLAFDQAGGLGQPAGLGALGAALALCLVGATSFSYARSQPIYLTSVNIAPLEDRIYHLQAQVDRKPNCLLLVDHNWSWTRGQLILGDGVQVVEKKVSELTPALGQSCAYIIVPGRELGELRSRAAGLPGWQVVARATDSGYVLLDRQTQ